MKYPGTFEDLIDVFKKFPGVGSKSAERMAYQVLEMEKEKVEKMISALKNAKENIHFCKICGHICEDEICDICQDESRDSSTICVVQTPKDVFALEKAKEYKGAYHVLHGIISASNGIGPNDINLNSLLDRVKDGKVKEIIIATNPTIEGETTALYISRLINDENINVTRLAYGLPVGASLDYADQFTLIKAIEGRRKI